MLALVAMLTTASAQDLDAKYATRLLTTGTEAPDMVMGTGSDGQPVQPSP